MACNVDGFSLVHVQLAVSQIELATNRMKGVMKDTMQAKHQQKRGKQS